MFYFQNIYYLSMLIYEFIQTFIYLLQYITSALQSEIVRNMIIKVIDKQIQSRRQNKLLRKENKMQEQFYSQQEFFGQELEEIQQIYIKTSYGNIFAHAVGKHGQPLIIVVHGSGPKNSADQYIYLLHQYLVRISYIQKFFIIAIDCPGYGRSKGSKEAVKTFPLKMFTQILTDLNYTSYYAMLGHSQGGAAIFNAVYQNPKLTQFLLMDRPVCGNIKRFNKFPTPTLLIYDIEDDGHPLWQGKLLYKQLMTSQFYTYKNSINPYWVPDNIWGLIICFFKKFSSVRKSLLTSNSKRFPVMHRSQSTKKRQSRPYKSQKKKKSISLSKCQQIKKQKGQLQLSLQAVKQIDKSQLHSKVAELQQLQDLPTWLNQPKIQQTQDQIKQQEKKKNQQIRLMTKLIDKQEQKLIKSEKIQSIDEYKQNKFSKNNQTNQKVDVQLHQSKKAKAKKDDNSIENENKCSICHQSYYFPTQTNCKHIYCKKCIGQSLLVDERCPLCRTKISTRIFKKQLHQKLYQELTDKDKLRRQKQLNQFQHLLKSIIYIQIGNNSRQLVCKKSPFTKTKTKYVWQVYVKQPKNFKFEQVLFNINMGNNQSVPVKVGHAPFVFESRGTFSFSCQITIKPKNREYNPITCIYRIDVSPGNHSKMIAIKKKI